MKMPHADAKAMENLPPATSYGASVAVLLRSLRSFQLIAHGRQRQRTAKPIPACASAAIKLPGQVYEAMIGGAKTTIVAMIRCTRDEPRLRVSAVRSYKDKETPKKDVTSAKEAKTERTALIKTEFCEMAAISESTFPFICVI